MTIRQHFVNKISETIRRHTYPFSHIYVISSDFIDTYNWLALIDVNQSQPINLLSIRLL